MEQIRFDDIGEVTVAPRWPKCFETCANFSNIKEDGSKDYFMDWFRMKPNLSKPRCVVGLRRGVRDCDMYLEKEE